MKLFIKNINFFWLAICLFLYTCGGGGGGESASQSPAPSPVVGCTGASPTWTTSPDYASVSSCVTQASAGDTVIVSAGTANWGTNILTFSKAIILAGAGKDAGTGTVISGTGQLIYVNTGSGNFPLRVSGFNLTSYGSYVVLAGTGSGWRIDNNTMQCGDTISNCRISIVVGTGAFGNYGLIDNNTFSHFGLVYGGNHLSADVSWKASAQWGTGEAIFVENNTFTSCYVNNSVQNCIDSNNGARWTVRYNDFRDAFVSSHSACQTSIRGTRSMEIYNNFFSHPLQVWQRGYFHPRGGSNLVTRNFVGGRLMTGNNAVMFDNRRSWDVNCTGAGTFGACDGANPYDMNLVNPAHSNTIDGWRCLDQIGAGTQTGTMGSGGTQASDPLYVWGNTGIRVCIEGANKYSKCTSDAECPGSSCTTTNATPDQVVLANNTGNQPYHVIADRDYYSGIARPGWSPYACPHPLTGLSRTCNTAVAGTAGYQ